MRVCKINVIAALLIGCGMSDAQPVPTAESEMTEEVVPEELSCGLCFYLGADRGAIQWESCRHQDPVDTCGRWIAYARNIWGEVIGPGYDPYGIGCDVESPFDEGGPRAVTQAVCFETFR